MKTEDIPYDYTYCYATDEQCPKAVHCLCSHAARLNEEQAISLNSRFTGDQKRHPELNNPIMIFSPKMIASTE